MYQFVLFQPLRGRVGLFLYYLRHGPFDILGGGAWDILEKNFLALILTKKNKLAQWHSEKNNLSPIV